MLLYGHVQKAGGIVRQLEAPLEEVSLCLVSRPLFLGLNSGTLVVYFSDRDLSNNSTERVLHALDQSKAEGGGWGVAPKVEHMFGLVEHISPGSRDVELLQPCINLQDAVQYMVVLHITECLYECFLGSVGHHTFRQFHVR